MLDKISNYEVFKSGEKLNQYVLAILGLIYSFWTYGLLVRIFQIDTSGRYADEAFIMTTLRTYYILAFFTTLGLLWGIHISEARYIKLWTGFKLFEFIVNFVSFLGCLSILQYRFYGEYIPIALLLLVFGTYITLSVWNLYKKIQETKPENNFTSEEKGHLNLPPMSQNLECLDVDIPRIHKNEL